MSIPVTCPCGAAYDLQDEFLGQWLRCPQCNSPILVGGAAAAETAAVDPAFARDKFLFRQKHFAIAEKYVVWDEQGSPILFIIRPQHLLRNVGAVFVGILAGLLAGFAIGSLLHFIKNDTLVVVFAFGAIAAFIGTTLVVGVALSAKRHISFYRDESKRELLLEVLQDNKVAALHFTYTLRDPSGQEIARFRKNYLFDFFRKRWDCQKLDGSTLLVAKEDSMILSLLRRFLGPLFGILRTNFVLLDATGENVLGEFNRKLTLLDRYVLDLSRDPRRTLDRRIAVALGVLLDTGERR